MYIFEGVVLNHYDVHQLEMVSDDIFFKIRQKIVDLKKKQRFFVFNISKLTNCVFINLLQSLVGTVLATKDISLSPYYLFFFEYSNEESILVIHSIELS